MFEMYAEPETSFGDITRYFAEHDIKIYGKSMFRTFLSQLLRNPVYAQADLEPVSYTHLDVYKRQLMGYTEPGRKQEKER